MERSVEMTTKLYELAHQQGISVLHIDIPENCSYQAIYEYRSNYPFIILATSILHCQSLHRSIFAEELGHHFTSVGKALAKPHYRYGQRLTISRIEYRALCWATRFLIPIKKLLDAVRLGIFSTWELAEHFVVTEEFMKFRLKMPEVQSLMCRS